MRLSDAIAMGRLLVKPSLICDENHGCVLHMGLRAISSTARFSAAFMEWRWLLNPVEAPCQCERQQGSAQLEIIHLFDRHVMLQGDWTLEQLIDYVRSIEPSEPDECVIEQQSATEVVAYA